MSCVLCNKKIKNQKWAIRDYTNETYSEWIIRHIRSVLTRGFRKYTPLVLPVCEECYKNIVQETS